MEPFLKLQIALNAISVICTYLSSAWWLSSATKASYAEDEKRSADERKRLEQLSKDRNIRAGLSASVGAFAYGTKWLLESFRDLGWL